MELELTLKVVLAVFSVGMVIAIVLIVRRYLIWSRSFEKLRKETVERRNILGFPPMVRRYAMLRKRRFWVIVALACLIVVGGFLALMDRPTFSQDEVRAVVQNHFINQYSGANPNAFSTLIPEYIGKGKWAGETNFDWKKIYWYFYEKTRTIEIR